MHAHATNPAVPGPEPLCHWRHADRKRRWATACQHRLPRSEEVRFFAFCPYCGRRLLIDRRETGCADADTTQASRSH